MTIRALRPYILAVLMTIPGLALHLAPPDISPLIVTALAGMAILGASFLLTWACEVAQMDMPQAVAVAVVALAVWWGAASIHPDPTWEPFDPETFTASLGKEFLLLEFTADWCPSCKAIEHTTLTKKRMADLRKKYNVRTIRVDLTRDDGAGKELLKALNSTSIPVLALFPKGESAKQPLVLRDLVTPKQLKEAASRAYYTF